MYTDIIIRWKRANPGLCHSLGIHEFDGDLPNFSRDHIKQRVEEIREDLSTLKSQRIDKTNKIAIFENEIIVKKLETELFELDERKEYLINPLTYIRPLTLIEMSFTTRSFASIEDRVKIINRFLKNIPEFIEQAQKNLQKSLAKPVLNMSIGYLTGILAYYKDKMITFITQVDDESLIDIWSESNIQVIEKMEELLTELQNKYMENAHENFAMGSDKFQKLIEKSEGITISVDELLTKGKEDLETNYQCLVKLADEYANGDMTKFLDIITSEYPDPDKLIEVANQTLVRTRQFLIDSDIVTIPTEDQPTVIRMPESMSGFAFAAMSTPGPFEIPEASESYYWINPPDPKWPEERQQTYMKFFHKGFLETITIHEAWPGHYLQLLYNKQSKSEISKMFARSITMIEGWGHYSEELVYQEGYEPFERYKLHVGQLIGALIRNVRFVCAIQMHCKGMTVHEAKALFIEKGGVSEDIANIEANRGTVDPIYYNYTLGKMMIKKLRSDYQKEKGENFNLKEFHDTLLSYGSPPIMALRNLILDYPEGPII